MNVARHEMKSTPSLSGRCWRRQRQQGDLKLDASEFLSLFEQALDGYRHLGPHPFLRGVNVGNMGIKNRTQRAVAKDVAGVCEKRQPALDVAHLVLGGLVQRRFTGQPRPFSDFAARMVLRRLSRKIDAVIQPLLDFPELDEEVGYGVIGFEQIGSDFHA